MATQAGSVYVNVLGKVQPGSFAQAATQGVNAFGNVAKGGFSALGVAAGNLISQGISAAVGTIRGSLDSAISRVDILNNFPRVMKNLGLSADDAQASIAKISDKLVGLPTTLQAGASAVQRFASYNGDIAKSTDMFLALNNAILAGGASSEIQASALEQLTQSYSKGKMDMMEWRTAQMAMAPQLKQVAAAMGLSVNQLGAGLRQARKDADYVRDISMDEFIDQIIRLNTEGGENFASFEEQARAATDGIGTHIANFKNRIVKDMAEAINEIGSDKINGVIDSLGRAFASIVTACIPATTAIADFVTACMPFVEKVAPALPGVAAGFLVFNKVKGIVSFATQLKNLKPAATVATKSVGEVGAVAEKAASKAGNAGASLGQKFSSVSKSIAAIGAAVLMAGAGFYIMAQAANVLGQSGNRGLFAFAMMGGVLIGLTVTIGLFASKLKEAAPAIAAIGAAVLLAGAGFGIMAAGAVAIGNSGDTALGALALMEIGIIALVAVIGKMAAELDLAVPAILSFGACVLMIGGGIALAVGSIALLVFSFSNLMQTLPIVAEYGESAAQGFSALGAAAVSLIAQLAIFTPVIVLAGAAVLAAGIGIAAAATACALFVASLTGLIAALPMLSEYGEQAAAALSVIGTAIVGVVAQLSLFLPALVVITPAMLAFGAAVMMAGAGIAVAAAGASLLALALTGLVMQLPLVAQYGDAAGTAFVNVATGLTTFGTAAIACLAPLLGLDAELIVFAASILATAGGVLALAGAFTLTAGGAAMLGSVISGIANDCASAVESMWTLQGSVDIVSAGMQGMQGVAQSVFAAITGAFASTSGSVQAEAWNMVNGINSAMNSASSGAFEAGARVGEGLANGMRSQWWNVHNAAQSLVDEAQRAVEARAKIGSPSRLFNKVGRWIPAGFAGGIVAGVNAVRLAANGMVGAVERATDSFMPRIANTGTLQGATATAGAGGAIGGNGGATIYFDNARLNDDVEIRNAAELLFKEIRRKEAM